MVASAPVYKGHLIWRDAFRYIVRGRIWGGDAGEDLYRFRTLKAAKAFIDRLEAEKEEQR